MASMADIVVGAVAAVIGTPQRTGRLPEGFSPADPGEEAADQVAAGSTPSPEAFGIGTPAREEQPAAAEAGSVGSRLSNAEALQGRLDAANEAIAQLNLQLGEARAQLASAVELREMAVKFAAVEAKSSRRRSRSAS